MYSSTAVFVYSLLLCRIGLSMFLLSPAITGIELARPQEHLSTPPARRCRLLCVVNNYFSHCCCAVYHSQAEFLVVSPPFSPVSPPRTFQQWQNGIEYAAFDRIQIRHARQIASKGSLGFCSVVLYQGHTSIHPQHPYIYIRNTALSSFQIRAEMHYPNNESKR